MFILKEEKSYGDTIRVEYVSDRVAKLFNYDKDKIPNYLCGFYIKVGK